MARDCTIERDKSQMCHEFFPRTFLFQSCKSGENEGDDPTGASELSAMHIKNSTRFPLISMQPFSRHCVSTITQTRQIKKTKNKTASIEIMAKKN